MVPGAFRVCVTASLLCVCFWFGQVLKLFQALWSLVRLYAMAARANSVATLGRERVRKALRLRCYAGLFHAFDAPVSAHAASVG